MIEKTKYFNFVRIMRKVCFYPPRISKGGILNIYIMGIKIKAKEQDCRKYISVCSSLLQDILG